MENKSTFKSTEFWLAGVLPQVFALISLFGFITPDQASEMQVAITQIVGGVVSFGGSLGYGVSRGLAKKQ